MKEVLKARAVKVKVKVRLYSERAGNITGIRFCFSASARVGLN